MVSDAKCHIEKKNVIKNHGCNNVGDNVCQFSKLQNTHSAHRFIQLQAKTKP